MQCAGIFLKKLIKRIKCMNPLKKSIKRINYNMMKNGGHVRRGINQVSKYILYIDLQQLQVKLNFLYYPRILHNRKVIEKIYMCVS